MTRLAEAFCQAWGRSFGRIRPRDEREERPKTAQDYAAERCVAENAKWSDPDDKCWLPPGACPFCLEHGERIIAEQRRIDASRKQ